MWWNYSLFMEEDFIGLLKSGELDDSLEEVFRQFRDLSPKLQYELISYVKEKKKLVEVSAVAEGLGIRQRVAEGILSNGFKSFSFPAVDSEGKGVEVKAIVIKDLQNTYSNLEGLKRYIKEVEAFLRGEGLIEGSLGVIFDRNITGRSFQLSLALALYPERIPDELCFTGGLDKKGNILKVDGLRAKESFCKEKGKRLINPMELKHIGEVVGWFRKPFVEVPFLVSKDTNTRLEDLGEVERTLKYIKLFHGIQREELELYTGRLEGEAWKEVCIRFNTALRELEGKLKNRLKLSIAINGPATLAFALGVLYTSKKPFIFNHFVHGEGRYFPIEVVHTRELKELVEDFEHTASELMDRGGKDIAVILTGAHHASIRDVESFLEKQGISADILMLKPLREQGNIPPELHKHIAKEYATGIQRVKESKSYESIHFFFSVPISIAFMVGTAYGHYGHGYIYNYEKNTYTKVLEIGFLRSLIEKGQ